VDDYQKEIADLEHQLAELEEAQEQGSPADRDEMADLRMQVEILRALYARALELYQEGDRDTELRQALAMRGYGPWSFDNVYAWVYEQAVELPDRGHAAFVGEIRDADFAAMLEPGASAG
jgi:hypothetical protein